MTRQNRRHLADGAVGYHLSSLLTARAIVAAAKKLEENGRINHRVPPPICWRGRNGWSRNQNSSSWSVTSQRKHVECPITNKLRRCPPNQGAGRPLLPLVDVVVQRWLEDLRRSMLALRWVNRRGACICD